MDRLGGSRVDEVVLILDTLLVVLLWRVVLVSISQRKGEAGPAHSLHFKGVSPKSQRRSLAKEERALMQEET